MTIPSQPKRSAGSPIDAGDLAMLATILIWSGNNVFTKAALNGHITPLVYVFLRFAIVSGVLLAMLRLRGVSLRVERSDYPRMVLIAVTGFALYNLLFVAGLARTTAFSAAILVGTAPIFALLLAAALGLEHVRRVQWIGVLLAFVGVAVFVADAIFQGRPASGDLLNLLAAFSFAIYGLTTRGVVQKYGSPAVTAWGVTLGLVMVAPVTLPTVAGQDWGDLGRVGWGAVLYASLLSMLVAYTLWGWAIGRSGTGRTVPYLFLIPVMTGTLAYLFLDDPIGVQQIAGAALALGGVALARRSAGRIAPESTREPALTSETSSAPKSLPG